MKKNKPKPSEEELAHRYANKIIDGKIARGHFDERFKWHKRESKTNKDLWLDTDFFFSVVFQSQEQKYQFLDFLKEKFGIKDDTKPGDQIQIINGLELAAYMGLALKKENMIPYLGGDLDLRPFVLDTEKGGKSNGS